LCQEKSGVWALWRPHLRHTTTGPQVKSLSIPIPTGWIEARFATSRSSKDEPSPPAAVADAAEPTREPETMGRRPGTSSSLLASRGLASYLRGRWTMPTCCAKGAKAQGRASTTCTGARSQETSRSTCCSSSYHRRTTSIAHRSSTPCTPTSTSSLPRGAYGPSAIDGPQAAQTVPQVAHTCDGRSPTATAHLWSLSPTGAHGPNIWSKPLAPRTPRTDSPHAPGTPPSWSRARGSCSGSDDGPHGSPTSGSRYGRLWWHDQLPLPTQPS
jgi:hypothetical protein